MIEEVQNGQVLAPLARIEICMMPDKQVTLRIEGAANGDAIIALGMLSFADGQVKAGVNRPLQGQRMFGR